MVPAPVAHCHDVRWGSLSQLKKNAWPATTACFSFAAMPCLPCPSSPSTMSNNKCMPVPFPVLCRSLPQNHFLLFFTFIEGGEKYF